MTKLLEKVWKESEHICQDVINHPFNQELTNGTLSRERFCYYLGLVDIKNSDIENSLLIGKENAI